MYTVGIKGSHHILSVFVVIPKLKEQTSNNSQ